MDSNYPWGVPTRGCVRDLNYQKAVTLAKAAETVALIPNLASTVPLHNQVNAALRRTDLVRIGAERLYQSRSPFFLPWFLPKEFYQLLNPKWLVEDKLSQVQIASVALGTVRNGLKDKYYSQIKAFLDSLKGQLELIQKSSQANQNPLAHIRQLWNVLNQAPNGYTSFFRNLGFFELESRNKLNTCERSGTGEAAVLYAQHQALTQKSDVIVRFNETYVDTKTSSGLVCILLQPILAQSFYTSIGLGYRVDLRDLVAKKLQTNGSITVNGMVINLVGIPGSIHLMCKTDGNPTQALVDLLGVTITPSNHGDTLRPNEIIVKELTWVYRYRQMTSKEQLAVPPCGWSENLLGKYKDGFESDYGIPLTEREKVERLHYLLANPTRLSDFS